MTDLINYLHSLMASLIEALWGFLTDIFLSILEMVLQGIVGLLSLIAVPDFALAGKLQYLFNQIPGDVWYFAGNFRLGECLAIFGAGVSFRLVRKLVTLGQW